MLFNVFWISFAYNECVRVYYGVIKVTETVRLFHWMWNILCIFIVADGLCVWHWFYLLEKEEHLLPLNIYLHVKKDNKLSI